MYIRILSFQYIYKHLLLEAYIQAHLSMHDCIYAILDACIVQKKKWIAGDVTFKKLS